MKKYLLFLSTMIFFMGVIQMYAQQRKVLFEEFTSSTCPPCASMNSWLNPLLATNADKIVVIKYQMNWPGTGDPYYTAEGGVRRSYYGVNSVPYPYTNGVYTGNQSAIQTAINNGYAQPAEAIITGDFKISGNTVYVKATVTPLISGENYVIHCSVDEKVTTENRRTNGETEFHHVMMKMLPNANGTPVTLVAEQPIILNFSYDMSSTNVEEMSDLEVIMFVQNKSTKAVLNAAYLTENNTMALPPNNVAASQESESLNIAISWDPITESKSRAVEGYNVYRNGVKVTSSPISETSYTDAVPEYGQIYTYLVAGVVNGVEGFCAQDTALTYVNIPIPINVTVKQTRGLNMHVIWEMPETSFPISGYYLYRNDIPLNSGAPVTETYFDSNGVSYREYCFKIEPFVGILKGEKSEQGCVTLVKVPEPETLTAQQVSFSSTDVALTWTASASNAVGYNIYRDNVKINDELITSLTYTDATSKEVGVEYLYQVYGVANNGGESESSAEAKITLTSTLPIPTNVQAAQTNDKEVTITWDAITMSNGGYNIYRDDVKINNTPIAEATYLDNVSDNGTYCYKITVIIDGVEGEKSEPGCIKVDPLAINEVHAKQLVNIYPNPVANILTLETEEIITNCQIFDIQGHLIYSTENNVREIITDNWPTGVYIIRITTGTGSTEKRFIKN